MEKEILELYDLIKNKNIEKAYSVCKKLYRTNKNNKNIVKVMAYLFIQKSQYLSAMDVLENFYLSGSIDKDFDYYVNMGVCKKSVEEYEDSIYMYEQAKNIDNESPLCYMVPAEIYLKLRDFKKSMELIDTALSKIKDTSVGNIHYANAIKLKTEIYVALNQDKENEDMLMGILSNDFYPDIFYLLSNVNKELINKNLLSTAEKQLKEYDSKYENRIKRFWYVHPIYFGLAVYYNNKDKKKSEEFYEIGNKEIMGSLRYNSFEYQKDIVKIMNCFKQKIIKKNVKQDHFGENNIFILGTPRSGTTLIEQMNSIVEKINWSGGSYWGEPNKFKFKANIESFEDATEMVDNERMIKTTFSFNFRGYLIPESFNEFINTQKYLTPKQIVTEGEFEFGVSSVFSPDSRTERVRVFSNRSSTLNSLGGSTDFIRPISPGYGNAAQDLEFTNTFGGDTFYIMRGGGSPTSSKDDKAVVSLSSGNEIYMNKTQFFSS